ncbi:DMT family transporter [Actinocorallia longicatena]|uniref:DMT family transporter n=2 Tax=Actinocorallia longicatena TaxID=111803 RepID=A0ABP6PW59_9ACTN
MMLFLAMSVIWGIPYLLIKVAVEGVSAPLLVFARCAIGVIVLLPLAVRGEGFSVLRGHGRWIAAFAVLEIFIPWLLLSHAEKELTSSLSGLLIASSPILSVVFAKIAGGTERLGLVRWAGLGLGFVGVAVLAAPGLTGGDALSVVEVLLTATGYAVAPIIADRKLQGVPTMPLTAVCLGSAALFYLIPAALTLPDEMPSGKVIASILALGLICTALAFVVFLALIGEVGPSRALVFTYVNPAVAVTAGVLLLGEPLTAGILAAFALILTGSVLATRARRGGDQGSKDSGADLRPATTGEPL